MRSGSRSPWASGSLQLLQGVVLDLADALAGDPERAPDLLERAGLRAVEAVAELDYAALAVGERERDLDVLAAERRDAVSNGDSACSSGTK